MTAVDIDTYLRQKDGSFVLLSEANTWSGNRDHVEGAISLQLDTVEVLGKPLWDDVDWLWASLTHALDDYRCNGHGQAVFPDQPISISAARAWQGHVVVRVTSADGRVKNAAVAAEDDLFPATARAGLYFFEQFSWLTGRHWPDERRLLSIWLESA